MSNLNEKDLVRDPHSGALLNNNTNAYKMYKAQRQKEKEAVQQMQDVSSLKEDIAEIKQLLREIAQRVK
jgi:hypothetical protein